MAQALRLSVVPADAQTVPGGRQSLSLAVQNTAHSAARCHLDVSGIPDDWYMLDKRRLTLGPGEREHVLLALTPPAGLPSGLSSYPVTIGVTSEDDRLCTAATVVMLTVGTSAGLSMDVVPREVEGQEAAFYVTYHNHSLVPMAATLAVCAEQGALRFHTAPAGYVAVPPRSNCSIAVQAVPVRRLMKVRPRLYTITFRSLRPGQENGGQPALSQQARFQYVPSIAALSLPGRLRRISGWAVMSVLVPLLLLLVVISAHALRPPARKPAILLPSAPGHTALHGRPTTPRARATSVPAQIETSLWPPNVLLNPHALRFGGQDVVSTVHVVNVGSAPFTITRIAITGAARSDFVEHDTCTTTAIRAYTGCTIDVRFTPRAHGARTASLVISDNAAHSPQTVALTGHA